MGNPMGWDRHKWESHGMGQA